MKIKSILVEYDDGSWFTIDENNKEAYFVPALFKDAPQELKDLAYAMVKRGELSPDAVK